MRFKLEKSLRGSAKVMDAMAGHSMLSDRGAESVKTLSGNCCGLGSLFETADDD